MAGLATHFTDDHRACDTAWAAVEGAEDPAEIAARFKSFDALMRRHLAWEEDVIFPAFEEATGMTGGPTAVMRHEHTQMRAVLDEMSSALEAGDTDLLLDHGDTLLMLIQQHNPKEEQILYPMADRVLGGQWAELRVGLV